MTRLRLMRAGRARTPESGLCGIAEFKYRGKWGGRAEGAGRQLVADAVCCYTNSRCRYTSDPLAARGLIGAW